MTRQEFLNMIKTNGATVYTPPTQRDIALCNANLQRMRIAMLPPFMSDLFSVAGAINLGNGYIYGVTETLRTGTTPIPSIGQINADLSGIAALHGKTVFGRNDLFWFSFNAFGKCEMLDNTTARPLREYSDPMRALTDCLIAGK